MACVNNDGTLSEMAKSLLKSLGSPLKPEEISGVVGKPLFLVRSSLRELTAVGMILETAGQYQITSKGREALLG